MTKRILITAGGTGGHIFPGLAVAEKLREQNAEIVWLGTKKGMEDEIVSKHNIPFYAVDMIGVRGNGLRRWLLMPWRLLRALFQSIKIIRQFNPDVVLAMGGYVSAPAGIAAWLLRKSLIIHEQNAAPGLSNKLLACFAKKILTGFPNVLKGEYVGNPVRTAIAKIAPPSERFIDRKTPFRLFVFGGSRGALSFNVIVPKALAEVKKELSVDVLHQAGSQCFDTAKKAYDEAGVDANIVKFVDDMADKLSWADCVICRSGAITVAELSAVGVPAILIPYPYHKDQHQKYNADFLVKAGAGVLVLQKEFTSNHLAETLNRLFSDRKKLLKMAEAGWLLRKTDAAERICEILLRNTNA